MDTAAVDLEIVDKIEVKDDEFFHLEDIKKFKFTRALPGVEVVSLLNGLKK